MCLCSFKHGVSKAQTVEEIQLHKLRINVNATQRRTVSSTALQLYTSPPPGKGHGHIWQEAGYVPEPILKLWRRENSRSLPMSGIGGPVRSTPLLVSELTDL